MAQIKAIIFDMDGVLIEAKNWHYESLNKALGLFGMQISKYDHLVTYDGLPTREKLKMFTVECGLPEELHKFINTMKQQYTMEIVHAQCKPRFYHEYALARLKNEGFHLAVCSNSIRQTVEAMIEKASLTQYFDFMLSNEDVARSKPHPEIYETAIKKLGFAPQECLIVEDNENGIKAATASGANLLQVNNVEDVNYQNITDHILKCQEEKTC